MIPTSASDDQEVRDVFARWASLQAGAPRDPGSLIEHVDVSHDHLGLLDTDVQGRRVVWKSVPVSARTRVTIPTVTLETVDPWSVEPVPLRERSIHIAICASCAGEKKARCTACGGTGKTLCGMCNGARKAYGYSANGAYRLLNCATCRGKGQLDCAHCRRGIAICAECNGEGRGQRWIEIETWRRSVSNLHPRAMALQFAWSENPATEVITRDAELLVDVDRPHRLTPSDLDDVAAQWLDLLGPELMPGERVARQRLRIARVPTYNVEYRLGDDEDRISFTGLRLIGPQSAVGSAFARRIAKLRSLRRLLFVIGMVLTLVSLGRGFFFWSLATFLSLLASSGALIAIDTAVADWTAARTQTRRWLIVATSCLVLAIAFALVSLPRIGHAQYLVATAQLENAESELRALGDKATPSLWADLRLARIRQATDIAAARTTLTSIPRELPQHALAADAVDALILRKAQEDARLQMWTRGSEALALLSPRARDRPDAAATATAVYVPLAQQRIVMGDWSKAADMIVAARALGVAPAVLDPLIAAMHKTGVDRAAKAKHLNDARQRLIERLAAEETLVSWERASELRGTPSVIALRTAMARDVVAIERSDRKRHPL